MCPALLSGVGVARTWQAPGRQSASSRARSEGRPGVRRAARFDPRGQAVHPLQAYICADFLAALHFFEDSDGGIMKFYMIVNIYQAYDAIIGHGDMRLQPKCKPSVIY